jgi:quercetin dioxygenase-like cupin family protein
VLNGDPAKGASTMVLKATKGCKVPWHWHSASEQIMMTAGSGKLEMKDGKPATMRAGAYGLMPAHHVHQFSCMTASCTLFLRSDGVFDIHYVDAAGKEIPGTEALKSETSPAK